jgi:hypothetical protein
MAAIFLDFVRQPWPLLVGMLTSGAATDTTLVYGLLLLAGGLVNAVPLYYAVGWLASLLKKER